MRRITWIIVPVIISLATVTDAQSQKIGVTGGLNIANLNGISGASSKNGMIIGGFVEYDFIGGFAIQPEVLFSMKGASGHPVGAVPVGAGPDTWTLNYIEVPLLLKFDVLTVPILPASVDLYAGPDFAFNVASKDKSTFGGATFTTDESGNTHPFDFNIAVGGGPNIDLGLMTLGIELRYTFGTSPVFKGPGAFGDVKNGVWSIMASAAF